MGGAGNGQPRQRFVPRAPRLGGYAPRLRAYLMPQPAAVGFIQRRRVPIRCQGYERCIRLGKYRLRQVGLQPSANRLLFANACRPSRRVPAPLYLGLLQDSIRVDRKVPKHSVRGVRVGRKPIRPRGIALYAADLGKRQHRQLRPRQNTRGDAVRIPAELHRQPRIGKPQPSNVEGKHGGQPL